MKKRYKIIYALLTCFSGWLKSLTIQQRNAIAQRFAGFVFHYFPLRKTQALGNIRRAFPDKSPVWQNTILRRCFGFFTVNFFNFLALPKTYTNATINVKNKQVLDEAVQKGIGVILITGHFGAWEILAAWLGYQDYRFVGIAQRQRNRGADRFFREQRELSGVEHIYRKASLDKMYSVLKKGMILGLVSDQDAKQRGVFVNFFGHPASTPKGAAMFHLRSGVPMVFTSCQSENVNEYTIEFSPVIPPDKADVTSITQIFTNQLEGKVRQYPEQYFWFHRRWKTTYNSG